MDKVALWLLLLLCFSTCCPHLCCRASWAPPGTCRWGCWRRSGWFPGTGPCWCWPWTSRRAPVGAAASPGSAGEQGSQAARLGWNSLTRTCNFRRDRRRLVQGRRDSRRGRMCVDARINQSGGLWTNTARPIKTKQKKLTGSVCFTPDYLKKTLMSDFKDAFHGRKINIVSY